jgi:hypothetical protein
VRAAELGCDAITILGKDDKVEGMGSTSIGLAGTAQANTSIHRCCAFWATCTG